jgi:phosphatidylserine synthase
MQKISTIVLYILVAISVILASLFFAGGTVTENTGLLTDKEPMFTAINLAWAYLLFVIALVLTLAFSLYNIITNPKAIKGTLIALLAGVVLVVVAYLLASDAPVGRGADVTSAATLKWVGTGLYVTYILGGLALLSIVVSEIYRALS